MVNSVRYHRYQGETYPELERLLLSRLLATSTVILLWVPREHYTAYRLNLSRDWAAPQEFRRLAPMLDADNWTPLELGIFSIFARRSVKSTEAQARLDNHLESARTAIEVLSVGRLGNAHKLTQAAEAVGDHLVWSAVTGRKDDNVECVEELVTPPSWWFQCFEGVNGGCGACGACGACRVRQIYGVGVDSLRSAG